MQQRLVTSVGTSKKEGKDKKKRRFFYTLVLDLVSPSDNMEHFNPIVEQQINKYLKQKGGFPALQ